MVANMGSSIKSVCVIGQKEADATENREAPARLAGGRASTTCLLSLSGLSSLSPDWWPRLNQEDEGQTQDILLEGPVTWGKYFPL